MGFYTQGLRLRRDSNSRNEINVPETVTALSDNTPLSNEANSCDSLVGRHIVANTVINTRIPRSDGHNFQSALNLSKHEL